MGFDGLIENPAAVAFLLLAPLGVFIGLAIQHWTRRWMQRVCTQVGEIPSKCALSGREAAARLLAECGLGDVAVRSAGPRDAYDSWKQEIRLGPATHDSASLSALAIAAHEVGHAQQSAERNWRCRWRSGIWFVCCALPVLVAIYAVSCFLGVFQFSDTWFDTGIILTCVLAVLLPLPISLPLERDATRRANHLVRASGLLADHERGAFDRVLHAAWKTHVAAEVHRWITFTTIAVAAAGFLWCLSCQDPLPDQMRAQGTLPSEQSVVLERLPQPNAVSHPVAANDSAHVAPGFPWPLVAVLLVIVVGVILLNRPWKPRLLGDQRLTAEENAVQRHNAAAVLQAEGKHDAAIEEFTRAIELNPRLTMAWYHRGRTNLLTGRLEEALRDFDSAVHLAPHFLDAIAMRGHARLLLRQEDQGLADLEIVLSLDPANREALAARTGYYSARGECELALADCGRA